MQKRSSLFRSLDPTILSLTVGLLVFGLVMLLSATVALAVSRTGDSWFYVKRQLLNGILPGMVLFFFFALVDYRHWRKLAVPALICSIILLILVYIPGLHVVLGGARGWIRIGPVQIQPSEFVKFGFLLYLSAWLANRHGKETHHIENSLLPFLAALGSILLLLILQPDTGSMSVVLGMSLFLYFLSGAPIGWFVGLSAAGLGLVGLLIRVSPYRAARFMTFLHPELDPLGVGYHINQALLAIGSGGIWGLGYGHSRQKFLYLPEVEADSISAVMAEEMGFIVMVLFFVAMAALVWRCLSIARSTDDRFGMYLAAGVGAWVAIQTFLNVASMTGVMPMTGVTLPFVSHGGSAMVALLAAMGLVAGISKADRRRSRV